MGGHALQAKLDRQVTWVGGSAAAPAIVSAGLVAMVGTVTISTVTVGPLSLQMLLHLVLMNVLAPLGASFLAGRFPSLGPDRIWMSGLLQILLLWAWHAPSVQQASVDSPALQLGLSALLFTSAVAFWSAVIAAGTSPGWRSIAGLMLTGKIACLLGVLLIFAPRDLYVLPGLVLALCETGPSTLADQQLAGLLMITACPLSYLVAAVVLSAQMLARIDTAHGDDDVAASSR